MAGIFAYSTTAGSNTSVGGVSIAEGMSPANVNNAIRAAMADIATSFSDTTKESFYNGTAALAIASGGTGATSAAAALTALGALAELYRDIPPDTQATAFTLADSMRGRCQRYTGGAAAATINPYGTTPINVGGAIFIRVAHNATGALTITRGAGVSLRISGQTTDQNVVVAVGGECRLYQEATNMWIASGAGIS